MTSLKALLWDVSGSLAEAGPEGHRLAFNLAFAACGLPWNWDARRYGELAALPDVRERLLRDMSERPDAPSRIEARDALARRVRAKKEEVHAELLRAAPLPLRAGVALLVEECLAHGVRMAIATGSHRADVEVLLRSHWGAGWPQCFRAVFCAEDVARGKPDPEGPVRALLKLCVVPREAIAIEDSPVGVGAAHAVRLPVLVTRSDRFARARFRDVVAVGPGLDHRAGWEPALDAGAGSAGRVGLADIEAWLAGAATCRH